MKNIDNLGINGRKGYFGKYGGKFIPEILKPVFDELECAYLQIKNDEEFAGDFIKLLKNFSGRPTPMTYAENMTKKFEKANIYIKREDLNHSGAHKITNVMGQGLLMKRLGKTRVIAETGAGQHGVATAIMAAKLGFEATIYMGEDDVKRQFSNVFWMRQLGAEVISVSSGTATLKDAINEAIRDWTSNFENTHYCLGTACGAYPFPEMVTFFQKIIGEEIKKDVKDLSGKLPDRIYACLGGGSNAMGAFYEFLPNEEVELIAVEAGGKGEKSNLHAARLAYDGATPGVAQGYKTVFLQDGDGQMKDTWSISAGLDYTGVSPIAAHLKETGRIRVEAATDDEVIRSFKTVVKNEGIIPALESTHAFATMLREIDGTKKGEIVVVNMSGRGDKDIFNIAEALDDKDWKQFIEMKGDFYGKKL